LAIYGKACYGYWKDKDMLLDVLYFSTNYSTSWVVFIVVLLATSVPLSVGLFVNRRAVAERLRRKKTGSFWVGLACFLFFAVFVFGPAIWQLTNKHLFPEYGHEALDFYGSWCHCWANLHGGRVLVNGYRYKAKTGQLKSIAFT
jgi:hypothetical protein